MMARATDPDDGQSHTTVDATIEALRALAAEPKPETLTADKNEIEDLAGARVSPILAAVRRGDPFDLMALGTVAAMIARNLLANNPMHEGDIRTLISRIASDNHLQLAREIGDDRMVEDLRRAFLLRHGG